MTPRRVRAQRFVGLTVAIVVAGCSGEGSPPSSSGSPGSTIAPVAAASPAVAGPADSSSLPPPDATVPPPAAGVVELSPGLLSALEMGVPETWAALDFEPALVDDPALAGDIDPLRSLVTCPPGALRDDVAPWIARRFSAIDAPMDNGLLSVELLLELEPAADHVADLGLLAQCTAVDAATLTTSTASFEIPTVPARTVEGTRWQVTTEATDDTPFAYTFQAVWAHDGDYTVAVILGGQPTTADWPEAADKLAARALTALVGA